MVCAQQLMSSAFFAAKPCSLGSNTSVERSRQSVVSDGSNSGVYARLPNQWKKNYAALIVEGRQRLYYHRQDNQPRLLAQIKTKARNSIERFVDVEKCGGQLIANRDILYLDGIDRGWTKPYSVERIGIRSGKQYHKRLS